MNINAYDTPAPSQVVNTYVPLPIDAMLQAAAQKQQAWDLAEAQELELESEPMGKALKYFYDPATQKMVPVSHYDQAYQWLEDYKKRVENLASNLGIDDKGSPMYRIQLQKLRNELARAKSPTGVLGGAEADAKAYEELQKMWRENKNLASNPWMANQISKYLNEYAKSGLYGQFNPGIGLTEYVDIEKEMTDLMKGIEGELVKSYADPDGSGYLRSGWKREVPLKRLISVASGYLSEGKIADRLRAERENLVMRGYSEEEVDKYMQDRMNNIVKTMAERFYSSEGRQSISYDPIFGKMMSERLASAGDMPYTTRPKPWTQNPYYRGGIPEIDFDKDGKVYIGQLSKHPGLSQQVPAGSVGAVNVRGLETAEQRKNRYVGIIEDYREKWNLPKNLTQKEVYDIMTESEGKLRMMSESITDLPDWAINGISSTVLGSDTKAGDFPFRKVFITNKTNTDIIGDGSVDQVSKELGYGKNTEKLQKSLGTGKITAYTQTRESPLAFVGQVIDSNGRPRQIIVEAPPELQKYATTSFIISNAIAQNKEETVELLNPDGTKSKVHVKPQLDTRNREYRPEIFVEYPDGRKEEVTLGYIRQLEHELLVSDPFFKQYNTRRGFYDVKSTSSFSNDYLLDNKGDSEQSDTGSGFSID